MKNKEIPIKPIINCDGYYPQCPTCEYFDLAVTGKKHTTCPKCGQLIDWTWLDVEEQI